MSNLNITSVDANTFPEFDTHKRVLRVEDSASELLAFISIHNTNRGPAIGGTRYWHYEKEEDALRDSLRLSRAMTYKCAIAEVPFGGAKGVIIAPNNASQEKKDAILTVYAKALTELGEPFYTGEDVGLNEHDVELLEQHSNTIVGRPEVGGLPAQWAALSVYYAMQGASEVQTGSPSLKGKSVTVKGLGGVGMHLCKLLEQEEVKLYGTDVIPEKNALAKKEFPSIEILDPKNIHQFAVDIFSPCALGNELNEGTIPQLNASIICGAANNQLATIQDGKRLFDRGILYVPDYIANAGGLISVADELNAKGYSQERVTKHIKQIRETIKSICSTSIIENQPTNIVADNLARQLFTKA